MTKNKRTSCKVLGRVIGSMTGWVEVDDFHILFSDYEPLSGFDIPAGDISVNFQTGKVYRYQNDKQIEIGDIVLILSKMIAT